MVVNHVESFPVRETIAGVIASTNRSHRRSGRADVPVIRSDVTVGHTGAMLAADLDAQTAGAVASFDQLPNQEVVAVAAGGL